jgi:uncharacterized protein YjiS (DUF1127 family)
MFVVNQLISAGKAFSEWRKREQAYSELMALDDHSLADIGLHRSQIAGLVDGIRGSRPASPPAAASSRKNFARPKAA